MKSYFSLLFVSSLLFISCKKEVDTQNTTPTNIVPFTEVGRQMQNQSQTTTQQQQNTDPTAVATGANPAHGQPGHRCDIAVGAPLNSPAATNASATPQQNAPVQANTVSTATTQDQGTPTAEGMNPPHGQTNHRCDIAVGAPLPK
ncbi:hypothetical protein EKL97_06115 [Flavobacterium sp. LS1P28]|uniref:hypothetical protein n=1 Tax=Flavobacterium sp. LS1P28 TaxID=2497752 RepID=UPI000F81879D|nr:hypothetical protein [Flavobacterium sp. LS1P28]RTY82460.1 hypothetical protein EKL97_06115 [Flavobacterium sp. LS1P28]RTY94581.1 hypothetical protein EKL32_10820 [Flavobacterium sp. GSN2]